MDISWMNIHFSLGGGEPKPAANFLSFIQFVRRTVLRAELRVTNATRNGGFFVAEKLDIHPIV